jgi:glycosyltransferase involved in cell wall biosynthesis
MKGGVGLYSSGRAADVPRNSGKILFIASSSPLVPFSGYSYRALGILRWLSERFEVDVIFEGEENDVTNSFVPLERLGTVTVVQPHSSLFRALRLAAISLPYHHARFSHPYMRDTVLEHLTRRRYSLIWLNKTVHYPIIKLSNVQTPFFVDQHAAEPIVWDNLICNDPRWYAKPFFRFNKSKVLKYDLNVYKKASGVICISKLDYETTRRYYPDTNLVYIPQGFDPNYYKPDLSAGSDPGLVLFSGTGALRNVQAMKLFVATIMPIVHESNKNVRVLWIGNVDKEKHSFLQKPWIKTTGFVDHTPPCFDRGMVYVAPFDMGEGMKTKIIEAMAMGKVIVTTPVGVQGIAVEGLPFVRVCSEPKAFANAILDFITGDKLPELSRAARTFALENYAWDVVLRPLESFLSPYLFKQ